MTKDEINTAVATVRRALRPAPFEAEQALDALVSEIARLGERVSDLENDAIESGERMEMLEDRLG